MNKVVKITHKAHSAQGALMHLGADKPDSGILITRVSDGGWEWRFFGEATVVELIGAMEMVKEGLLADYRKQSERDT